MRMSDCSSDVCASDLHAPAAQHRCESQNLSTQVVRAQRLCGDAFIVEKDRRAVAFIGEKIFGEIQLGVRKKLRAGHRVVDQDALTLFSNHTAKIPYLVPEGFARSEEHTSELQSLMRISYAVFCLKKKTKPHTKPQIQLNI